MSGVTAKEDLDNSEYALMTGSFGGVWLWCMLQLQLHESPSRSYLECL